MKTFLAVSLRELAERRMVFAAALLLGVIPLVSPWMPIAQHIAREDVIDITAFGIMIGFCFLLAMLQGASLFSRDLVEQRLSFYYARPISHSVLWGAKLTAAMILLVVGAFCTWIPSLFVGGRPWLALWAWQENSLFPTIPRIPLWELDYVARVGSFWRTPSLGEQVLLILSFSLLALLLSHLAVLSMRVRSAWIVLDFVMLPVFIGAAFSVTQQFVVNFAYGGLYTFFWRLLGCSIVSGLLAIWVQISTGRTMGSRAHGASSLTFWIVLVGLGFVTLGPLVQQMWNAEPEDLAEITHLRSAPQGDWLIVAGPVEPSGLYPAFLVHRQDGRHHALGLLPRMPKPPLFSEDGQVVAWSQCFKRSGEQTGQGSTDGLHCEVRRLDLEEEQPRTKSQESMTYTLPWKRAYNSHFPRALSADGGRFAIWSYPNLVVQDLQNDRLLASLRVPQDLWDVLLEFESDERLRLIGRNTSAVNVASKDPKSREQNISKVKIEIWELDLAQGTLGLVREVPGYHYAVDPHLDRLAVWGAKSQSVEVFDGWGERLLFTLRRNNHEFPQNVHFLPSGTLILSTPQQYSPAKLRIFAPDGREISQFESPEASFMLMGHEVEPGQVLLGIRVAEKGPMARKRPILESTLGRIESWETLLLDLETGHVLERYTERIPLWSQGTLNDVGLLIGEQGLIQGFDPRSQALQSLFDSKPSQSVKREAFGDS